MGNSSSGKNVTLSKHSIIHEKHRGAIGRKEILFECEGLRGKVMYVFEYRKEGLAKRFMGEKSKRGRVRAYNYVALWSQLIGKPV